MANFLVLINGWYSNKLVTGGEYHMLRVLKNWSLQHKISVLTPKLGYQATKEMLPHVDLFYFSSTENDEEIKSLLKLTISYIIRIIRSVFVRPKHAPDLIITASHLMYDIIPAIILRKRYKSKLVVYNHGVWGPYRSYNEGLRSNLMLLNEKISLFLCKRSPDIIFAINDETKTLLIDKGFKANKIAIMRNGVEHELIKSVKVDRKEYEASFCARLVKRKGIYDLLDIWRKVLQYFPEGKLVIIGQGEEYEGLQKAIRIKGLEENIELTGYVSDKEKIAFFKSSKIFVYPSYEESWGITVTEAMACRLPVVCYNLSAYNFLKSGIIKLNIGDRDQMTSTIIDLLSNDTKRMELASTAEEESKKLNWDDISKEELNAVSSLLNK
jgi:glycosyltransferase involved in cell wall biosynthesis